MKIFKTFILLLVSSLLMTSCTFKSTDADSSSKIKFYVANEDSTDWITYEKEMDNDIKTIIETLISDEKSLIPNDTKVLDVSLKDDIAYIDLSKEFDSPNSNTSTISYYKINSIVKTLCLNQNLNINGVKFLIENKEVDSIGPMDTSEILREYINEKK